MTTDTQKIKVAVCGACGRMGQEVIKAVNNQKDMELVAAIDISNAGKDIGEITENKACGVVIEDSLKDALLKSRADVIVDFTSPDIIFNNAKIALECGVSPVIGTTGLSDGQVKELEKLSKEKNISALIAPNFTTGAVLMMMFAQTAAKYFDNAEIIELHHNKKKDAPSGTAIKTAQMMAKNKSNFASGNVPEIELIKGARGGVSESDIHIHSVRMPGYMASQEVMFGSLGQVLTIRHDSVDRSCYMPGVVMAIRYVTSNNEFVYGLENIL
ncbi:MAG: 4-hydroxy-tetrahydrodipicolinate reductase [Candidatus Gastranaerophilales bacterium]|nr:4-hydroxy-tetrahydrodipicolinate reductase [Candidatus Gastranaerophilales bacterium]